MLMLPVIFLVSCAAPKPAEISKEDLEKVLNQHPEILTNWMEKNATAYVETSQKVFRKYNDDQKVNEAKRKQQALEDQIKNPLEFKMNPKRSLGSVEKADIKIIEYSDFECPFCSRGFATVMDLKQEYGDRVVFEYRHLPLPFHPNAMPGALAFEAILKQDKEKAYKFHDEVFKRQQELKTKGEQLYLDIAKDLKVDMDKMKKDMDSEEVQATVQSQVEEARKYGISGTPGFLVNGVLVKGAYPTPFFRNIIQKTTKK